MKTYKIIIAILSTALLLLSVFSFRLFYKYVEKDYIEVNGNIIYHASEALYGQIEYLVRLQERLKEGRLPEVRTLYEGYKSATTRKNLYNNMRPYIYSNFDNIYSEEINQELKGLLEEISDLISRISEYVIELEKMQESSELDNGKLVEEINIMIRQFTTSKSNYGRTNYYLSIESILIWPYQVNYSNEDENIMRAIKDFKGTIVKIHEIMD